MATESVTLPSTIRSPVFGVNLMPAVSSSNVRANTVLLAIESNASSLADASTLTVMVENWASSSTRSSMPLNVTSCATFQLVGVNVSVAGATVASVKSSLVIVMTTFVRGAAFRTTPKVCVEPLSSTVRSPPSRIENPATSSSVTFRVADVPTCPAAAAEIDTVRVPSTIKSSIAAISNDADEAPAGITTETGTDTSLPSLTCSVTVSGCEVSLLRLMVAVAALTPAPSEINAEEIVNDN